MKRRPKKEEKKTGRGKGRLEQTQDPREGVKRIRGYSPCG